MSNNLVTKVSTVFEIDNSDYNKSLKETDTEILQLISDIDQLVKEIKVVSDQCNLTTEEFSKLSKSIEEVIVKSKESIESWDGLKNTLEFIESSNKKVGDGFKELNNKAGELESILSMLKDTINEENNISQALSNTLINNLQSAINGVSGSVLDLGISLSPTIGQLYNLNDVINGLSNPSANLINTLNEIGKSSINVKVEAKEGASGLKETSESAKKAGYSMKDLNTDIGTVKGALGVFKSSNKEAAKSSDEVVTETKKVSNSIQILNKETIDFTGVMNGFNKQQKVLAGGNVEIFESEQKLQTQNKNSISLLKGVQIQQDTTTETIKKAGQESEKTGKSTNFLGSAIGILDKASATIQLGMIAYNAGVALAKVHTEAMGKSSLTAAEDLTFMEKAMLTLSGATIETKQEIEKMAGETTKLSSVAPESFKKAVDEIDETYIKLGNSLDFFNADKVINEDEAKKLIDQVKGISDSVLSDIEEKKQTINTQYLSDNGGLLRNLWDQDTKKVEAETEEIIGIITTAKNNGVEITAEQQQRIEEITEGWRKEQLAKAQIDADYEINQYSDKIGKMGDMDQERIIEEVNNRQKERDISVNAVKEKYDDTLKELEYQISKTSGKEKEQLEKQRDDLKQLKDDEIQIIDKRYQDELGVINEKYPKIMDKVNKNTGKIYTEAELQSKKHLDAIISTADKNLNGDLIAVYDQSTGEVIGLYDKQNKRVVESMRELTKEEIEAAKKQNDVIKDGLDEQAAIKSGALAKMTEDDAKKYGLYEAWLGNVKGLSEAEIEEEAYKNEALAEERSKKLELITEDEAIKQGKYREWLEVNKGMTEEEIEAEMEKNTALQEERKLRLEKCAELDEEDITRIIEMQDRKREVTDAELEAMTENEALKEGLRLEWLEANYGLTALEQEALDAKNTYLDEAEQKRIAEMTERQAEEAGLLEEWKVIKGTATEEEINQMRRKQVESERSAAIEEYLRTGNLESFDTYKATMMQYYLDMGYSETEAARLTQESLNQIQGECDKLNPGNVDDMEKSTADLNETLGKVPEFKETGVKANVSGESNVSSLGRSISMLKDKTVNVITNMIQKGKELIGWNAMGTQSFEGGLSTVHEVGWELINPPAGKVAIPLGTYNDFPLMDIPQGTQIQTHETSLIQMRRDIKTAVKGEMNTRGVGGSNGVVNLQLTNVTSLDGKEIAKETSRHTIKELGKESRHSKRGGSIYV